MSAMSVLEQALELDEGLRALPLVRGVDGALVISPQCPSCGWEGGRRPLTSTARWCVAIACSLHTCMAPKRDLIPTVLRR